MMATQIIFTTIPITGLIGCGVPVIPGTPDTDAPLEERTELCAVDANWIVGAVPTCDTHLKLVCEVTDIDWIGVLDEAGRGRASAERPWDERKRHTQDDVSDHLKHFGGE